MPSLKIELKDLLSLKHSNKENNFERGKQRFMTSEIIPPLREAGDAV